MNRSDTIWLGILLAAIVLAVALPDAALSQTYFRGGILLDQPHDTRLRDKDCSSRDRLFGCKTGNDDAQEGSVVDFETMTGWEVGIGYAMIPALRLEAAVQYRPDFSFEGQANLDNEMLLAVGAEQDVSAELSVWSGLLAAYLDISLPVLQFTPVTPFVGAGAGLSRIEIKDLRMESPIQSVIVPGDHQVSFSWMLTLGVGVSLARWTIDAAWRYTDHGDIETAAGIGRRVCRIASCRLPEELPLDPTVGELKSEGFTLSVRYSF